MIDYYKVYLFRGAGAADIGHCDSLEAAEDMAGRMEQAAKNGRKALIYAIHKDRRAELVVERAGPN